MNLWVLIPLTLACFAGGILLSRWQARKQYRAHMADKLAREVEKEIARRVMERMAEQNREAPPGEGSQANTRPDQGR